MPFRYEPLVGLRPRYRLSGDEELFREFSPVWMADALAVHASGGHPFLLRRLGSATIAESRKRSNLGKELTRSDVDGALARELEGGGRCADYFRAQVEDHAPAVLALLDALRDVPLRQADVRKQLQPLLAGAAARDLDDALRLTQAYRLVVRDTDGKLDLFAPMFRDWLRDYR